MAITNFSDLIKSAKSLKPLNVSLAFPHNEHVLNSLYLSAREGLINPYITGTQDIIEKIATEYNIDLNIFNKNYLPENQCLIETINLIKNGTCNALMKGDSSTSSVMSLVLKKENHLRTNSIISHVFVLEIPTYHKLILITDAAININPSVEDRIKITKNAIKLANALGINTPKIGVVSALEEINPKMPTTLEARKIASNSDLLTSSIIEGPLAFDCIINHEAAEIKKIQSNIAGDVDIIVTPTIEVGNVLAKSLIYLANAKAAGIVLGAKIPIILTSRSDSTESKMLSTALASIYANHNQIKG
ncbi:bifunctional enoyl-CoA hydratase/phosphate acetyltransferase [Rickettsiales bacterium LUAb2]